MSEDGLTTKRITWRLFIYMSGAWMGSFNVYAQLGLCTRVPTFVFPCGLGYPQHGSFRVAGLLTWQLRAQSESMLVSKVENAWHFIA